jgi:polyisoprenoid-binding protein YceI
METRRSPSSEPSREGVAVPDRAVSVLRTHDDRRIPVAGAYAIDRTRTAVKFVARHMMISKVNGRFKEVGGQITIAETPEDSHVEVEIETASLDTGNSVRDSHLRSTDFFEVERYPTMTFRSTSVRARPDATWEVAGDLTVRDKTRPVCLRVHFDGADVSLLGEQRINFSAATELNRDDFGLTWNQALESGGLVIGKTVRIELAVQAIATPGAAVG